MSSKWNNWHNEQCILHLNLALEHIRQGIVLRNKGDMQTDEMVILANKLAQEILSVSAGKQISAELLLTTKFKQGMEQL